MKVKQRLLRMILNKIDADLFYIIAFEYDGIKLQGNYCPVIVKMCLKKGLKASVSDNGFTYLEKGCLKIVLT